MEPERPIEKLLRACAKKRRDEAGAPLELHPATRRLLQSEVARRFAREDLQPRTFPRLLARLWPRLAWGLAALAVLAVAVSVLLPPKSNRVNEMALARRKPALEPGEAQAPSKAPAPSLAEPRGQADQSGAGLYNWRDEVAKAKEGSGFEAGWRQADKDLAAAAPQSAGGAMANSPAQARAESSKQEARKTPLEEAPATESVPGVTSVAPRSGLAGAPPVVTAPPAAAHAPPPAGTSASSEAITPAPVDGIIRESNQTAAQRDLGSKSRLAADSYAGISATTNSMLFANLAAAPKLQKRAGAAQGAGKPAFEAKTETDRSYQSASQVFVLASFQVEQFGSGLRIIDQDGSVYSGSLEKADAIGPERGLVDEATPSLKTSPGTEQQPAPTIPATTEAGRKSAGYSFRVAGINRSLNQRVVFTGNLLPATNAAAGALVTNRSRHNSGGLPSARAGVSAAPAPAAPDALLLRNSRISGKAVLGNGQEFEVNAVPAKP